MKNFFARWAVACFLSIFFLASSWSLFHPRLFRVHDYIHGARIVELQRGLAEGQLPVRWSGNFGYGYGMPLFEFYAPLPSYFGALVYSLTGNLSFSVRLLFLVANAGTVIGSYWLGKKLFGHSGGILVSAAITLAPYRAVNLFVRGAISEAWAIMFLPFILYFGLRVLEPTTEGDRPKTRLRAYLGLVLSLTGLMLTHNLTTLMFVPLSFIFVSGYLVTRALLERHALRADWQKYLWLTGAYLLAGGLAAFYMLPAVIEKDLTQINSILTDYFHYSNHFLYIRQFFNPTWGYGGSTWGPEDGISFFLGWGQLVGLGLTSLLLLIQTILFLKKHSVKAFTQQALAHQWLIYFISGLFLAVSLWLTLPKSQWLWNVLPVLAFIQFPWRWLSPALVFLALLVGLGSRLIKAPLGAWFYVTLVTVGLVANAQYFRPERYLTNDDEYYYADAQRIRTEMSQTLPDFMPIQLKAGSSATAAGTLTSLPPHSTSQLLVKADPTMATEIVTNRGHLKELRGRFAEPTTLTLAVAYFPGWTVYLDDAVTTDWWINQHGLIVTKVPAGQHSVKLQLQRTPIRQLADSLSALSLVVLLGFMVLLFKLHDSQRR